MLFLGNMDKLIHFRFYRRANLQESSRRRTSCLFLLRQSRFLQSATNVESFLLKRKEIGNYFLLKRKVSVLYLILAVSATCISDESIYVEKQMARFCLLEKRRFSWTAFQSVCSNLPIPVLPINFKRVCIFCLSFFFTPYYYITY